MFLCQARFASAARIACGPSFSPHAALVAPDPSSHANPISAAPGGRQVSATSPSGATVSARGPSARPPRTVQMLMSGPGMIDPEDALVKGV